MGRKVVEDFNYYEIDKAKELFTDRKGPQAVFKDNIIELSASLASEPEVKVVTFYGHGGIGKTSLCKELMGKLGNSSIDNGLYKNCKYVYFNFEEAQTASDVLKLMAKKLEDNYSSFKFRRLDYALFLLGIEKGLDTSKPELKGLQDKSELAGLLFDTIDLIPGGGIVSYLAKVVDTVNVKLHNKAFENKDEIRVMTQSNGEILREKLPLYFAKDMKENLENEKSPFVFFFDTYEQFTDNLRNSPLMAKMNDDWICHPRKGFVCNIPALYVFAGHQRLEWDTYRNQGWDDEEALEQHLLMNLDEEDVSTYLNEIGGIEEEFIEAIYDETNGLPLHIDLCVELYFQEKNSGNSFTTEVVKGDVKTIARRIIGNMNEAEKDLIYYLALFGIWTDREIEDVFTEFNIIPRNYHRIKKSSFIQDDDNEYSMNTQVRAILLKDQGQIEANRTKFIDYVKKALKNECIDPVIKDNHLYRYIWMYTESTKFDTNLLKEEIISELHQYTYSLLNDYIEYGEYSKFKKNIDLINQMMAYDDEMTLDGLSFSILMVKYLNKIGEYRDAEDLVVKIKKYDSLLKLDLNLLYTFINEERNTIFSLGKIKECIQLDLDNYMENKDQLHKLINYNYDVLKNIGDDYLEYGDYSKALKYYEMNLTLVNQNDDKKSSTYLYKKVDAYISLGDVYTALDEKSKALEYYEEVIKLIDEENLGNRYNHIRIESLLSNRMGTLYLQMGKVMTALEDYFMKGLDLNKTLLEIDDNDYGQFLLSNSYQKIGDAYTSLKKHEDAKLYFKMALDILEMLHEKQNSDMSLKNLSPIYYKYGYACLQTNDIKIGKEYINLSTKANEKVVKNQSSLASINNLLEQDYKVHILKRFGSRLDDVINEYTLVYKQAEQIYKEDKSNENLNVLIYKLFDISDLLLIEKHYEMAINELTKLKSYCELNDEFLLKWKYHISLRLGMSYEAQEEFDEAIKEYSYLLKGLDETKKVDGEDFNIELYSYASKSMGNIYFKQDSFDLAFEYYKQGLEVGLLEEQNYDNLLSLMHLSKSYVNKFSNNKEYSFYFDERRLIILEKLYELSKEEKDLLYLTFEYENLGNKYNKAKLFDRAYEKYERTLILREKYHSEYGSEKSLMYLLGIYRLLIGQYRYNKNRDRAVVLMKNRVQLLNDVYAVKTDQSSFKNLVSGLSDLADHYTHNYKYADAISVYKNSLEIIKKYHLEHKNIFSYKTLKTIHSLSAEVYGKAKDYDQMMKHFDELLKLMKDVLEDSRDVEERKELLGSDAFIERIDVDIDLEIVESYFDGGLELIQILLRDGLGDDYHELILQSYENIARYYLKKELYNKSHDMYKRILEFIIHSKKRNESNDKLIQVYSELGLISLKLDLTENAISYGNERLHLVEKVHSEEKSYSSCLKLFNAHYNLSSALRNDGFFDKAISHLTSCGVLALEIDKIRGSRDKYLSNLLRVHEGFGVLYLMMGDMSSALTNFIMLLKDRLELFEIKKNKRNLERLKDEYEKVIGYINRVSEIEIVDAVEVKYLSEIEALGSYIESLEV